MRAAKIFKIYHTSVYNYKYIFDKISSIIYIYIYILLEEETRRKGYEEGTSKDEEGRTETEEQDCWQIKMGVRNLFGCIQDRWM